MGFPRSIYAVLLIFLATVVVGYQVDTQTERMHAQQMEIRLGLERMLRLNESLTAAVALAVSERSSLRAASYGSLQAELDATMQTMLTLTKPMALAADVRALHAEQLALRALEGRVLGHLRTDHWQEAREALRGGDHVMALKLYEINSDSVLGALAIELAQVAQQQDRLRQLTLVLRLAVGVLLLWAGWQYGRRLRRELATQTHLRAELAEAGQVLEEKVKQRTLELEVANLQMAALSTTDGLTGLSNRRHFDDYWVQEWQRARRNNTPLAIIMMDVDHFKAYNDAYGHPQGDACLRAISAVLRVTVRRAGELVARYGGEEFVVVLPGASAGHAMEVAQAIRGAVQAAGIVHGTSPVAPVITVSLGVAAISSIASQSGEQLINDADAALYQAKAQGRNQAVMAAN